MRRRPLQIVFVFVIVGASAVAAVLITANVFFAGPSAATSESNATTACASHLDGGFDVNTAFAEAEHRDEIAAAAGADGLFELESYVSDDSEIFYVTGTGSLGGADSALVCTAVMVDGVAVSTQYEPAAGTWLG